jgi:hypothetical protein
MLRYGKKHDRCHNDKLSRSNRGRARTSATTFNRKHANRGFRRSQTQLAEIRAHKKGVRLRTRLAIQDALFDLELSGSDPEIWLHGTDLTTFEDTIAKGRRGDPSFTAAPYEHDFDDWDDWEYDSSYWDDSSYQDGDYGERDRYRDDSSYQDDAYGERNRYQHDWGEFDRSWDPDPTPLDAAWRDLWVDGHAHDPEGRDLLEGPEHYHWYEDDDYYDIDNPLLESRDPTLTTTADTLEERNGERRRAGNRYFKQTGRSVLILHDRPTRRATS